MIKQVKKWRKYKGERIPSSSELFPIIYKYINKNSKILDIGCGFGKTVLKLYSKGYSNVYGVDVNKSGVLLAQKKAEELSFNKLKSQLKVADALKLPFSSSFFDCIITQAFWTSILANERIKILKEIKGTLKKRGIFYMAVWVQTWDIPLYRRRYLAGERDGLERGSFEVKDKETGRVNYIAHHYTEEEIRSLLNIVGFKIKEYIYEKAKTQSGNLINYHVVISSKK